METLAVERLGYTPREAALATRIGKHEIYRAIQTGELNAVRIGRRGRLVIPVERLREWLDRRSS